MDAKDIEILQLQSGKPYLLGVGSFGSVCNRSVVPHHQFHNHLCMCYQRHKNVTVFQAAHATFIWQV